MEQDIFTKLYNDLKRELDTNYRVLLQQLYEQNGKQFGCDLVIKKGESIIALFEVKSNLKNERTYEQQYLYFRSFFSEQEPLFFVTDGDKFYNLFNKRDSIFTEVISTIKEVGEQITNIEVIDQSFFNTLRNDQRFGEKLSSFIEQISKTPNDCFKINGKSFSFTEEKELEFFRIVLNETEEDKPLYRYTSLNTLYQTLRNKKQALASILSMNDETECYYTKNYIDTKREKKIIYDKTKDYEEGSMCFIMSCTDIGEEAMKMWNEYGDKAQGVRICFRKSSSVSCNHPFWVFPVDYAEESGKHPALDFIDTILDRKFGSGIFRFSHWNVWQHFFKPWKYREEKEIRVLYFHDKENDNNVDVDWIKKENLIFPLIYFNNQTPKECPFTIDEIRFGPLADNKDINRVVIEQILSKNKINISKDNIKEIVRPSKIK